jgi:hypothetical protein
MKLSDFQASNNDKLGHFNNLLESRYGISINWDETEENLNMVLEHYSQKKKFALSESEMMKVVLITEAIRLYLREIAPSRKKKTRRNHDN